MKSERITVLASPAFKAFLAGEAKAEGISISELVRQRCERRQGKDEELLETLAEQLCLSNAAANVALDQALTALNSAQAKIKNMRTKRDKAEVASA